MNNINLYSDQSEFVNGIRDAIKKGNKAVLGVASPAFGKTMVAGYIIAEALKRPGATAWFLVHRKNLLLQTSKSFWGAKIEHGVLTSGRARSNVPVQVGTIGTVHSRLLSLNAPRVMFVDEAHLARGAMFERVIQWCLDSGGLVIGLTGTPIRLDGKALGGLFQTMVEAPSPHWLIKHGRLSDYEIYSTNPNLDLGNVKKSGGDYNREELAEVMDKNVLVGDVINHWRRLANGMRTVVYCVNVKHSKHTAALFNEAGIPAVHVDADTTQAELKDACAGLADGRYKVLCNCELVIEGFDLGSQVGKDITLECCILLRPTQSEARYLQMVFRALRKKPNPAIIIDHAGCVARHGLPDDEREWSLEGKKNKKRKANDEEPSLNTTQCPAPCFAIFRKKDGVCPRCGKPVEAGGRRELEVVDGELERIDKDALRRERKKEQGSARTLRDLVELGVRRGMNKPAQWAAITLSARQSRKPSRDEFNEASRMLAEIKANG